MSQHVTLLPVDVADVTVLVDNFLDLLLPTDEIARTAPLHYDWSDREQLIAEHGYSLLLTVVREGQECPLSCTLMSGENVELSFQPARK